MSEEGQEQTADTPETGRTRPRIRLRLQELEVPADDPFLHDRLERKDPVEVLTHLLDSIEGPAVVAIDSPWGTGKTSFLRMWAAHLRVQGFSVVLFNAWETDFSEEPFAALTAELTAALEPAPDSPLERSIEGTKKAAIAVMKHALPGAVRLATAGILDLSPVLENEIGQALAKAAEERLEQYEAGKRAIEEFGTQLSRLAESVRADSDGRPVVIIIDELDRCRPSYAVELLEAAKHLFSVDGVVFVIALDRGELSHSVKAIYGDGFDASGYLRRFFDLDYLLPRPDRKRFIETLIEGSGVPSYFSRTRDQEGRRQAELVSSMITKLLGDSSVGLRAIGQGIQRLGLVLGSLPENKRTFALSAAVLTILRTIDPGLCQKVIDGTASDADAIDRIFQSPRVRTHRGDREGNLFEAVLIGGVKELGWKSEASSRYKAASEAYTDQEGVEEPPDVEHARRVLEMVTWVGQSQIQGGVGFPYTVRRIELLSDELVLGTAGR